MRTRKSEIIGAVGTLVVHVAVIIFLYAMFIRKPDTSGESGVSVMLGNVDVAQGMFDPNTMTEVDIQPEPVATPEEVVPKEAEQEMITQTEEETVVIKPKTEPKPKPKKETPKKTEVKKPVEKTEAEKRAEKEKTAAEAASKAIAGAFGKGSKMGSRGDAESGAGVQGSVTGNSSTGKTSGVGGYGEFDLNGRELGGDGRLPKPEQVRNTEGKVVLNIIVNPAGVVINTSINKQTNTVNSALRRAAENAAKKARFNTIKGVNNQQGTITYYFNLN